MKSLEEHIEYCRQKMVKLASKYSFAHSEVVAASVELDQLLNQLWLENNKKNVRKS
ncbi:aspartyl-phosphate phosphatase Spo0E family protein [Mangrovibacillus cuniculi]|uniref:Aspartyl-phosphate phosphatase Spo0E family protein n=1 Tax=Mangrovibacillus cuniculi TaxID=2593652 RepID=A0A7S8CDQ1_9BACI|nr:aspartyl-phosphate phosphatase Spo0E family protein [Mangrovibacillus cuniculi]QPC48076.1 aspartyl-phosphate phosphatase Spo0E family protein [Mangrovibacillus cuniculi]